MKKIITIHIIIIGFFGYGQESGFSNRDEEKFGTFSGNVQYFFMHRTRTDSIRGNQMTNLVDYHRHDNSSSVAFTLDYESPKLGKTSLNLSYVQSLRFQEYELFLNALDTPFDPGFTGAQNVQNDSFGILNNIYLTYQLDDLLDSEGKFVLGRFPLNLEFMTGYPIRQKEQAYQGAYIHLPDLENWDLTLGYLSRFSSWKSNPNTFRDITEVYGNDLMNNGQTFLELRHENDKEQLLFNTYFVRLDGLLNIAGFSFLKRIMPFTDSTELHLRFKGVHQWDSQLDPNGKSGTGLQPGVLLTGKGFSLEGGFFTVTGTTAIQNPFGAKWIISEPLYEIDFQRETGSNTFYIESSFRFDKGKIYALYLRTENNRIQNSFHFTEEYNLIASSEIRKRLNAAIKLAFFRGVRANGLQQLFDTRLVLNYSF